MNTSIIFPLNESNIRTIVRGEDTWYCLKDVCKALTIKNHHNKVKFVKPTQIHGVDLLDPIGRQQNANFISLAGVMRVIRHTSKQSKLCDAFMDWLTEDVAVQLIKTGAYKMHKSQIEDLTRKMNDYRIRADGFSVEQIINSDAAIKSVFSHKDENGVCRASQQGRSVIRSFFNQKYKHTCPDILSKNEKMEVVNYVRSKLVHHEGKIYYKS